MSVANILDSGGIVAEHFLHPSTLYKDDITFAVPPLPNVLTFDPATKDVKYQAITTIPAVYGSFSSTQIQTIPATTETPLTYDTADLPPVGVSCTLAPSADIVIATTGVYKVLSSIQCDKTTGGSNFLDMYPCINGTAVPNSATRIEIAQNQELVLTVEWFLPITAGQSLSIRAYSPVIGLRALAVAAAPPVPAIPSVITTILKIS